MDVDLGEALEQLRDTCKGFDPEVGSTLMNAVVDFIFSLSIVEFLFDRELIWPVWDDFNVFQQCYYVQCL